MEVSMTSHLTSSEMNYWERNWVSRLPKEFHNTTFENCFYLKDDAKELGRKWAKSFNPPSLYLWGNWGNGKTSFCYAILREMMHHLPDKFYYSPYVISGKDMESRLLQAKKSNEGDMDLIENLSTQDLLFIDDLDKADPSERFKAQLFQIIDKRYINDLPTFITSNSNPEQFSSVIDGAVLSRICDKTKWKIILFNEPDIRKQEKNRL